MKLPALLYGTESEVRKRSRAVEKAIAGGQSLADALAGSDEIDTREREGLILLGPPGSPVSGQQHFFPYVLPDQIADGIIKDRIDRGRERALFEELVARPWGVLGLLSMTVGDRWTVRHPEWTRELCAAIVRDWDTLVGEGPRYSKGSLEGKPLYELPSFLGPALHYCGVPQDELRAHLFQEGLPPLLRWLKPS